MAGASFILMRPIRCTKLPRRCRRGLAFRSCTLRMRWLRRSPGRASPQSGSSGTRFNMEQDFYRERLAVHDLKIVVPPEEARDSIHGVIYKELASGDIRETSRRAVLEIIEELAQVRAAGIVLANTELPLLIRAEDTRGMVFDSMAIHVNKAITLALAAEAV
jgi:aspartate/glutamate racemase